MINHEKCISMINQVLEQVGILDIVRKDNSVYVGGSLPSFIISQQLANKNDEIVCNDIDLYTTNYVKTLHNFSKYVGNQITLIKRTGVNVTFLIKDIPIQIVTSEFDSFYDDVIGNYDCTLVSAGFYPYENKLYTHQKFLDGINNKNFLCYYEKSNPRRIAKLTERAEKWYRANLEIVKLTENANFRPYYKNTHMIHSLQDIVSPPNYVQLYYNKFKCISCKIQQEYLMCKHCVNKVDFEMSTKNQTRNQKITILGGVNGFGKIIGQVAKEYNNQIYSTTRNTDKQNSTIFSFELNKPVSDDLMNHILTSDIVVLNAYSTLENDERIWTTTIDTFDEKLAMEKFMINSIGYAKFLKEFVAKRKGQIKTDNLTNNIQLVFMDANESKFEGKLSDGKHLELNMAKTATKQIFYTNANLLASLGVLTMCYDPGWLSYHGISVDKIESKSKYLIPPEISASCLLYALGQTNFDKYIEDKKMIYDCSVYEIIKELIK